MTESRNIRTRTDHNWVRQSLACMDTDHHPPHTPDPESRARCTGKGYSAGSRSIHRYI